MFTLIADNAKYVRVRRGVEREELETKLRLPVKEAFAGEILERGEELEIYIAKPLENYGVIARKLCVSEEELKSINFARPVYPTCKLFVPCKKRRVSI